MFKQVKRITALALLALTLVSSFTACNGGEKSNPQVQGSQVSEAVNNSTPEGVAETFVKALIEKDFKTALSCFGFNDNESFVTEDDIEFYLPRSSFADVSQVNLEEYKLFVEKSNTTKDTALCDVVAEKGDGKNITLKNITVSTSLNKENNWVVNAREFYNTNYTFCTAGGDTEVTVNGKKLSDELCTNHTAGSVTGLAKEYTLPYVGKKDIEVSLSCDNYTYTATLSTSSDNSVGEQDRVFKTASSEEISKCVNSVKDIWNGVCKDYKSGKKSSDLITYLSSDADSDICSQIYDGMEQLHKNNSGVESDRDDNFKLTQCKAPEDSGVFWLTDDKIMVNFDYELTWDYVLSGFNESMKRKSNIVLEKENGEYKIYKLIDNKLFTENNRFISEW